MAHKGSALHTQTSRMMLRSFLLLVGAGMLSCASLRGVHPPGVSDQAVANGLVPLQPLRTLGAPTTHVGAARFVSQNGSWIVTGGDDKTLHIWDTRGALHLTLTGFSHEIWKASLSPNSQHLAIVDAEGQAQVVQVLPLLTPGPARTVDIKTVGNHWSLEGKTTDVAFSPDGLRVALAKWEGTAEVWDVTAHTRLRVLSGHTNRLGSVAYSPDGTRIVTASRDLTARVWNAETGAPLHTLAGHTEYVNQAVFSADGNRIVTASDDKTARVWDTHTGALVHKLGVNGSRRLTTASFVQEGRYVSTGDEDGGVSLYKAQTGQCLGKAFLASGLNTHAVGVTSLAVTPTQVYTAHANGQVWVWTVPTVLASTW